MAAVLHSASRLREVTKVEGDDSFDPALDGCRQAVMLENPSNGEFEKTRSCGFLSRARCRKPGRNFFEHWLEI